MGNNTRTNVTLNTFTRQTRFTYALNMAHGGTIAYFIATIYRLNGMYRRDFNAGEWAFVCGACGDELYAPTRRELRRSHWIHTHTTCLGGY